MSRAWAIGKSGCAAAAGAFSFDFTAAQRDSADVSGAGVQRHRRCHSWIRQPLPLRRRSGDLHAGFHGHQRRQSAG